MLLCFYLYILRISCHASFYLLLTWLLHFYIHFYSEWNLVDCFVDFAHINIFICSLLLYTAVYLFHKFRFGQICIKVLSVVDQLQWIHANPECLKNWPCFMVLLLTFTTIQTPQNWTFTWTWEVSLCKLVKYYLVTWLSCPWLSEDIDWFWSVIDRFTYYILMACPTMVFTCFQELIWSMAICISHFSSAHTLRYENLDIRNALQVKIVPWIKH